MNDITHDTVIELPNYVDNYKSEVVETERKDYDTPRERLAGKGIMRLLHGAMGMVDEASEFMLPLKKHIFYGKEIDTVNLKEELGDILWYATICMDELGLTYEEVMNTNLEKLRKRYGKAFSEQKAMNRNLEEERKILEGSQSSTPESHNLMAAII